MQYRNVLTDEVRKFTAAAAKDRNKGVWVPVSGASTPRKTTSAPRDEK